MAMKYEMVRGDYKEDFVNVGPGWQPGGGLFYIVRSALVNNPNDDDPYVVFKVDMTDSDIIDPAYVVKGTSYHRYKVVITSDLTQDYVMKASKEKLICELQYVAPGTKPVTYPQFTLTMYKDANRRRS